MSDQEHKEKEGSKGHGHGSHGGGGQHGGGGHEEAHEGAPEWLISFADNVTLMMGFFVILLAMNMAKPAGAASQSKNQDGKNSGGPTEQMMDMAIAIRQAFHNPVDLNSTNPNDLPMIKRVLERAKEGFTLDAGIVGNKHEVQSLRPTNFRKPAGAVPFDDNTSKLSETGMIEARRIAKHFSGLRTILEIRGHASAAEAFGEMSKSQINAASKWDASAESRSMKLSFDRALAVSEVLVANGIDWRQIRIVACKDNDRVKPLAYDRTDQRENERVEVFPTDQVMPVYVPDSGAAEPTHP